VRLSGQGALTRLHQEAVPGRVSVTLCTFNGARFIGPQLDSILKQRRPPDELIISDDQSTDDTLAIAKSWEEAFSNAKVEFRASVNPSPAGIAANFQRAFHQAKYEFVLPCDQDDIWYPEKIARLVKEMSASDQTLIVHSDSALFKSDINRPYGRMFSSLHMARSEFSRIDNGNAFDVLLRRNVVTGATMIFRKRLLAQACPIPPNWLHDEWLAITASLLGVVVCDRSVLGAYRQHASNAVGAASLARRLGAVSRVTHREYCREQLHRLDALLNWVRTHQSSLRRDPTADLLCKVAHLQRRERMSCYRSIRVAQILGEGLRGRYAKYSSGVSSMLRDLIAP
jgi:glycosyltransferase involved in cell wall biosynthesis